MSTPQSFRPPRPLQPGAAVSVILPASPLAEPWLLDRALDRIRDLGFEPRLVRSVGDERGYLAASDTARARAVEAAFADPATDAVFALRGGYGCARLLPLLDWAPLVDSDKTLVGSSDLTALQMARLALGGPVELHAPMATSPLGPRAASALCDALAGEQPRPGRISGTRPFDADWEGPLRLQPGKAVGRLLGGNLSVFTRLLGTPYLPDLKGAILALEDVGEAVYRIDGMLTQLAAAGVLEGAAGIALGQFSERPRGAQARELSLATVLQDHLAGLSIPALFGLDFGHSPHSATLPLGETVRLDVEAGELQRI